MSKSFVVGDIHGAYRALRQCLERSSFDSSNDHLICLGDVCDGWPETKRCIGELMSLKNLTYILGNHDLLAFQWMVNGKAEDSWLTQGGEATRKSYHGGVPQHHVDFLRGAHPYFLIGNKLFVHAGIDPQLPITRQDLNTFLWDRNLARAAMERVSQKFAKNLTEYDEVYVGHTPILSSKPIYSAGVWLMDTGAGWSGVLSMMDLETKEVFVSDPVPELYPGITGRTRNL